MFLRILEMHLLLRVEDWISSHSRQWVTQRGQRAVLRLRLGYLNYATAQSDLRYVPWRSFGYKVRS